MTRILLAIAIAAALLAYWLTGASAAVDTDVDDDGDTDGADIAVARTCFLTNATICILDVPVPYYEVNGDSRWNGVDVGLVRNAAFKLPATPTPTRTPSPGGCNGDTITEPNEQAFYLYVNQYRLTGQLPDGQQANDWSAPLNALQIRPSLVKSADMSTHINESRGYIGHDMFGTVITACMDNRKWHGENQVGHECDGATAFWAFYFSRGIGTDYRHSGIMRDPFWKGMGADGEPNYDGVPLDVKCWWTAYVESP